MFWLLIMRHLKKEGMRGGWRGRRHAPSWFNLACEAPFDITPWSTICQCKMRGYFRDVERRNASCRQKYLEKKGGKEKSVKETTKICTFFPALTSLSLHPGNAGVKCNPLYCWFCHSGLLILHCPLPLLFLILPLEEPSIFIFFFWERNRCLE